MPSPPSPRTAAIPEGSLLDIITTACRAIAGPWTSQPAFARCAQPASGGLQQRHRYPALTCLRLLHHGSCNISGRPDPFEEAERICRPSLCIWSGVGRSRIGSVLLRTDDPLCRQSSRPRTQQSRPRSRAMRLKSPPLRNRHQQHCQSHRPTHTPPQCVDVCAGFCWPRWCRAPGRGTQVGHVCMRTAHRRWFSDPVYQPFRDKKRRDHRMQSGASPDPGTNALSLSPVVRSTWLVALKRSGLLRSSLERLLRTSGTCFQPTYR